MKHGLFMTIAAILALIFGLAFLLVPAQFLGLYGLSLDPSFQWIARYLGSAFAGLAVLTWMGRNVPSGPALRAILMGDFVVSLTGLVVAVLDRLYGEGNSLVWLTVVLYLLLTLGFGYFVFVKPPQS